MNNCNWCGYNLSLVYPNFSGYNIFNTYGYPEYHLRFCSINCCIANINSFDEDISINEKRMKHLSEKYIIKGYVSEARPPKRLQINGGNLTYEEYRENFFCPKIENQKRFSPKIREDEYERNEFISDEEEPYNEEMDEEMDDMENLNF
jgi:hypothetical protein